MATLSSLPGELHNNIVARLDAIGLISLSQTNQHFRSVIKPNKREFGEWLLALEDRHEHEARAHQYSQLRSRRRASLVLKKSWELHQWACTGCLRMLPHAHFDADSLWSVSSTQRWRLCGYIKTSWTPSPSRAERALPAWERLCNECQYQAEILSPPSPQHHGQRPVPVQRSRIVTFRSALDRFYPGLERVLGLARPVSSHGKECPNCEWRSLGRDWETYLIRCSRCERWQEMREFRDPPMMYLALRPGAACNSCFAEEFDREALAEELLPLVKRLIRQELSALESWLTLDGVMKGPVWDLIKTNRRFLSLIESVAHMRKWGSLTRENIDWLTKYHGEYMNLRAELLVKRTDGLVYSFIAQEEKLGFAPWTRCFDMFKAEWLWLAAWEEKIDREPGLLAEWSLGRDGAELE